MQSYLTAPTDTFESTTEVGDDFPNSALQSQQGQGNRYSGSRISWVFRHRNPSVREARALAVAMLGEAFEGPIHVISQAKDKI